MNEKLIELARQMVAEADAIEKNNLEIARLQKDNLNREATIGDLREQMRALVG